MRYLTPAPNRRHLRTFIASLLSYLMLAGQFAPLVAASGRPAPPRGGRAEARAETPTAGDSLKAVPAPAPVPLVAPVLSVTKVDIFTDPGGDGAEPGQAVTYEVTIQNTGNMDATNVTVNDTVDSHTTIVPGSVVASPLAFNDTYNVIGNVPITPDAAQGLLANDRNPNTGDSTGLTASGPNSGPTNGQVTINADGSFTYTPNPGYTGPDSFTYTVTSPGGTDTATVNLTVANPIWFVNSAAPAGGDGRLSSPFNCLVGPGCFDPVAADDPGDAIFLFSGNYTGGLTLLNNQRLVGQGATASLASILGVTVEPYSEPLPATGGANPVITTTAAATNAINLGAGNSNLLRGFTVGNTTGSDISSTATGFGTLTVSEVTLNGTGRALNLDSGTLAATFQSIASTGSPSQGILLDQIAGSLVSTGGTTISGVPTQGILVTASTANMDFGNTSVSAGTDGVSLQSNSAGTRTFGTLSITGGSGVGFLHSNGGGATTIGGPMTVTNPAGTGIDVQNSNANLTFNTVTVNKGTTAGTGVNLLNNATRTITLSSPVITTSNGTALSAAGGGTVQLNGSVTGSIDAAGGAGILANGVSFSTSALTHLSASGGSLPGISLTNVTGSLTIGSAGGSAITGNSASSAFFVSGGDVDVSYGGTVTQANAQRVVEVQATTAGGNVDLLGAVTGGAASTGVLINNANGNVSFVTLTLGTSGARMVNQAVTITGGSGSKSLGTVSIFTTGAAAVGINATNSGGAVSTTAGTVDALGAAAVNIVGASAAARTPLSVVLADLISTNSGGQGVNLNFVSGNLTVSGAGTDTNIVNSTGVGIQVQNSAAGGTMNFGDTIVSGSGATGVVLGTASNGNAGAVAFGDFDISPDASQRALHAVQNTGAITNTSGNVTATNVTTVEIVGVSVGSRTPLNLTFDLVSASSAAKGIVVQNASTTGSPGGFRVLGTGTTDGSGGAISSMTNRGAEFINADGIRLNNMTFTTVGTTNGADPTSSTSGCSDLGPAGGGNLACAAGIHLENVLTAVLTNVDLNGGNQVGINGNAVTDFTLANSNVLNFGDQVREDGLKFRNMLGTSAVTGTSITGNEAVQVHVENLSGTLTNLAFTGNTVSTSAAPNGSHGILFDTHTTATGKLTVQNSTFSNLFSNCIDALGDGASGGLSLIVTGSTFTGCGASGITLAQDGAAPVGFNIANNGTAGTPTFLGGTSSHAININQAGNAPQTAVLQGAITNNFIGNNSSPTSSTVGGSGIQILTVAPGTLTALVSGNTVRGVGANGINAQMSEDTNANHRLNITLLNNTATVTDVNSFDGIRVVAGALTNDAGTLCAEINNNDGAATAAGNDFTVRQRFATTFQLRGYTGGNTDTAAVQTHLDVNQANDPLGPGLDWFISTQAPGGGFVNTPGGAQCPQPTVPTAPETFEEDSIAPGGITTETAPDSTPSAFEGGVTSRPFVSLPQAPQAATAAARQPAGQRVAQAVAQPAANPAGAQTTAAAIKPRREDAPRGNPPVVVGDNITFNLGTLQAGKTVKVTFQVVIDNPPNAAQVSNQAQVTADGGINVLSDDPSVPGTNNPTVTPINRFNSTTTLVSDINPSNAGQTVTFTATVALSGTGSGTPTGTVDFIDTSNANAVICNDVPLASGVATCQTSTLTVGTHNIQAVYSGDGNFDPSTSNTVAQVVANPITIKVNDARVAEPASGSTNMLFTVTLSGNPSSNVTVDFTTAPDTVGPNPATAGTDYSTTSGSLTFMPGQRVMTVAVPVLADAASPEPDETFLLQLSNAAGGNISDGTATGTITAVSTPGTVLISEFRTVGPGAANDSNDVFVEVYNNSDAPVTVTTTDGSPGWGLFKTAPAPVASLCSGTPILVGTIPAGTVIPARGHFLLVGTAYSLASYAAGDAALSDVLAQEVNLGLFNTTDVANLSSVTRLDAVGSGSSNLGENCALLREGNNVGAINQNLTSLGQHSFFRKLCDFVPGVGCSTPGTPKDTNDNAADFQFGDTSGTNGGAGQRLGAPGPENLASPRKSDVIGVLLLDATAAPAAAPNRVRDLTSDPGNNATFGTMSIRRRVSNTTGAPVTRLRFRISELTTFPAPAGTADLRAITSAAVSVVNVGDAATCGAAPTPCTVTVQGTTLEQPPAQPNGGGLNATLTVTLGGGGIPNGQSVNVQFLLGVQQTGLFRFLIVTEALP